MTRPRLSVLAEEVVAPVTPLRVPGQAADGTTRSDGRAARRLIHLDGRPVVLGVAAMPDGRLRLEAAAARPADAAAGVRHARFWAGVDDDVRPFLERFADDPLIGRSVREAPWLRPYRRPLPFDVLLGAVCEQLITDERARRIKQSIVAAHGPRLGDLRDVPDERTVAALAPAQLEACGLAGRRALTLVAVAREVAGGRIDLLDPGRREEGWRRLRAIPGIGSWTVSTLALHGQGNFDALPAGDHAYRTALARLDGRPGKAREEDVVAFFERWAGWRGIAGWHLLRTLRRGERPRRRPG